jgi:hypothetical protein
MKQAGVSKQTDNTVSRHKRDRNNVTSTTQYTRTEKKIKKENETKGNDITEKDN